MSSVDPSIPLPRSERLSFRWWTSDDLELAWGLWGDPRVVEHIDARPRLDRRAVQERLAVELTTAEQHGVQYWPTFLRSSGEHVGCAGLRPRPDPGVYELGFHLRVDHWGRGLASEAARAVIANAFEHRAASSLFAGHSPDNEASRRILLRLGFTHTHEELYPPTGRMHPSYRLDAG